MTDLKNVVTGQYGAGPDGLAAPSDAPGEARGLQAFADANSRRATVAEHHLLSGLAARFDQAARDTNVLGLDTGWGWVTAGVYEAVAAGSTFVAPRRLQEILSRWQRDGVPGEERLQADRQQSPVSARVTTRPDHPDRTVTDPVRPAPLPPALDPDAHDIALPHGFGSRRTWAFTVSLLAAALEPATLEALVQGSSIAGYANGEVTIAVSSTAQADRLAGEYRDLVTRKLGEAMRRPVSLAVLVQSVHTSSLAPVGDDEKPREMLSTGATLLSGQTGPPDFIVVECGLPNAQVWAAVIDEVVAGGDVSRLNVETWLRSSQLIGRGMSGSLIIGAPHVLAQRRIESRFLAPLTAAARAVLGIACHLEIVIARDWLAHDSSGEVGVA